MRKDPQPPAPLRGNLTSVHDSAGRHEARNQQHAMARMFRSSTQDKNKLVGSLDVDAKLIRVPKGWSAQTGALLLPDVLIGKQLGEGFQVSCR